jgi:hypothetical protein
MCAETALKNRTTTANKVLPKVGLNNFDWRFVQILTSVLRLSICAKLKVWASFAPPLAIPKPLPAKLKRQTT